MWDSLTTEDSYRISNTKNSHMFICLWYREVMESNIGTLLQQASTSDMWSNDHKCTVSPPCSHLTRNSHNYVFTSVNFCSLFFCQLFLVCLYAHKEMTCPGLLTILFADSRIAHYNLIHYLICLPRSFSKDLSRERRGPSLLYHTFRLFTFVSAPTSPSLHKSPVWLQRPGTWLLQSLFRLRQGSIPSFLLLQGYSAPPTAPRNLQLNSIHLLLWLDNIFSCQLPMYTYKIMYLLYTNRKKYEGSL